MKLENSIGWTDDTSNAVTGCDKVSEGCKNCYAQVGTRARVLRSHGIETWGPKGVRHPVAEFAKKLRRLNKLCICDLCAETYLFSFMDRGTRCACSTDSRLRRIRLFADSNSDWLDEKWGVGTLGDYLRTIFECPNVDTLVLTKRVGNWEPFVRATMEHWGKAPSINDAFCCWLENWLNGDPPPNIWFGFSAENQRRFDERYQIACDIPAKVRFCSFEPLLENIDLSHEGHVGGRVRNGLDWAIVGGESGDGRRDCGELAIASVVRQCVGAGVPVYCKQDCAFKSGQKGRLGDDVWARKEFPKAA